MSPTTAEIQRLFLSSPKYAVLGASKDQSKWGTKVLKWYVARDKDVTPIHPSEAELEGKKALKSLRELPSPTTTSVSVITRPQITLGILEEAKALDIPALWLQPGAEDAQVIQYAREHLPGKVILGGPCILVQGDGIIASLKQ